MKSLRTLAQGLCLLLLSFVISIWGMRAEFVIAAPRTLREAPYISGKTNQAKMEAASYIFRFYNRNLSEDKAKEYAKHVMEAAYRYSIEPSLITAIIIKESTAKATARSKYAVGLMQVYWQLHKKTIMMQFPHIRTEKILMEPRNNIMVGTWLFSQYMAKCKGDVTKALRRYLGSNATQYVALVTKYRGHFSERMNFNLKRISRR